MTTKSLGDDSLKSFTCFSKSTGQIAYVIIARGASAEDLNETIFKNWNVVATETRSSLVDKRYVDVPNPDG